MPSRIYTNIQRGDVRDDNENMYFLPAQLANRLFRGADLSYVRLTLTVLLGCVLIGAAFALGLADLTDQDATRGIKGALDKGAASAIAKLGVPGGFLDNPKVKIPLPAALDEVVKVMRMMGRGNRGEAFRCAA